MKIKKILLPIGIIIMIIIFGFALLPDHLRKALTYRKSSIDDYRIFENRTVETGDSHPWAVSAVYNKNKIPDTYLKVMNDFNTVAFLVVRNNEIMFENYWGGHTKISISNSFSMAKSIISLLVGIALDEGKIKNIDQPAGDFIPQFRTGAGAALTIKDLLAMSSGIEWDEAYADLFSITTEAYFGSDIDSLIKKVVVVDTPGKKFKYQSGTTQILAKIVEKAAGTRVSTYASEKLWKPLGAETDALWSLDRKDGMEKAFCCFNATARDFARIGQLVLNGGTWRGKRIVSEAYVKKAVSPASWLIDEENKPVNFYGYQFWIMHHRGLVIPYLRGVQGQYVFIIPRKNAVVVRLGEKRSDVMKNHVPIDAYEYIDAALELMK